MNEEQLRSMLGDLFLELDPNQATESNIQGIISDTAGDPQQALQYAYDAVGKTGDPAKMNQILNFYQNKKVEVDPNAGASPLPAHITDGSADIQRRALDAKDYVNQRREPLSREQIDYLNQLEKDAGAQTGMFQRETNIMPDPKDSFYGRTNYGSVLGGIYDAGRIIGKDGFYEFNKDLGEGIKHSMQDDDLRLMQLQREREQREQRQRLLANEGLRDNVDTDMLSLQGIGQMAGAAAPLLAAAALTGGTAGLAGAGTYGTMAVQGITSGAMAGMNSKEAMMDEAYNRAIDKAIANGQIDPDMAANMHDPVVQDAMKQAFELADQKSTEMAVIDGVTSGAAIGTNIMGREVYKLLLRKGFKSHAARTAASIATEAAVDYTTTVAPAVHKWEKLTNDSRTSRAGDNAQEMAQKEAIGGMFSGMAMNVKDAGGGYRHNPRPDVDPVKPEVDPAKPETEQLTIEGTKPEQLEIEGTKPEQLLLEEGQRRLPPKSSVITPPWTGSKFRKIVPEAHIKSDDKVLPAGDVGEAAKRRAKAQREEDIMFRQEMAAKEVATEDIIEDIAPIRRELITNEATPFEIRKALREYNKSDLRDNMQLDEGQIKSISKEISEAVKEAKAVRQGEEVWARNRADQQKELGEMSDKVEADRAEYEATIREQDEAWEEHLVTEEIKADDARVKAEEEQIIKDLEKEEADAEYVRNIEEQSNLWDEHLDMEAIKAKEEGRAARRPQVEELTKRKLRRNRRRRDLDVATIDEAFANRDVELGRQAEAEMKSRDVLTEADAKAMADARVKASEEARAKQASEQYPPKTTAEKRSEASKNGGQMTKAKNEAAKRDAKVLKLDDQRVKEMAEAHEAAEARAKSLSDRRAKVEEIIRKRTRRGRGKGNQAELNKASKAFIDKKRAELTDLKKQEAEAAREASKAYEELQRAQEMKQSVKEDKAEADAKKSQARDLAKKKVSGNRESRAKAKAEAEAKAKAEAEAKAKEEAAEKAREEARAKREAEEAKVKEEAKNKVINDLKESADNVARLAKEVEAETNTRKRNALRKKFTEESAKMAELSEKAKDMGIKTEEPAPAPKKSVTTPKKKSVTTPKKKTEAAPKKKTEAAPKKKAKKSEIEFSDEEIKARDRFDRLEQKLEDLDKAIDKAEAANDKAKLEGLYAKEEELTDEYNKILDNNREELFKGTLKDIQDKGKAKLEAERAKAEGEKARRRKLLGEEDKPEAEAVKELSDNQKRVAEAKLDKVSLDTRRMGTEPEAEIKRAIAEIDKIMEDPRYKNNKFVKGAAEAKKKHFKRVQEARSSFEDELARAEYKEDVDDIKKHPYHKFNHQHAKAKEDARRNKLPTKEEFLAEDTNPNRKEIEGLKTELRKINNKLSGQTKDAIERSALEAEAEIKKLDIAELQRSSSKRESVDFDETRTDSEEAKKKDEGASGETIKQITGRTRKAVAAPQGSKVPKSVLNYANRLAEGLRTIIGKDTKIAMMDVDDFLAMHEAGKLRGVDDADAVKSRLESGVAKGTAIKVDDNTFAIVVPRMNDAQANNKAAQRLISHEIAHVVHRKAMTDPKVAKMLEDAWREDMGLAQGNNRGYGAKLTEAELAKLPDDWMDKAMTTERLHGYDGSDRQKAYMSSFNEWYAENFVKWSREAAKPKNAIERYFKGVADAIKNMYRDVVGRQRNAHDKVAEHLNEHYRALRSEEKPRFDKETINGKPKYPKKGMPAHGTAARAQKINEFVTDVLKKAKNIGDFTEAMHQYNRSMDNNVKFTADEMENMRINAGREIKYRANQASKKAKAQEAKESFVEDVRNDQSEVIQSLINRREGDKKGKSLTEVAAEEKSVKGMVAEIKSSGDHWVADMVRLVKETLPTDVANKVLGGIRKGFVESDARETKGTQDLHDIAEKTLGKDTVKAAEQLEQKIEVEMPKESRHKGAKATVTKDYILGHYMASKDPTLAKRRHNSGYSDKWVNDMANKHLTAEERKFGDALLKDYYATRFDELSAVYEKLYGKPLEKINGYSHLIMDSGRRQSDPSMLETAINNPSMMEAAIRDRSSNAPFEPKLSSGGLKNAIQYNTQQARFVAQAEPVTRMARIYGDHSVRSLMSEVDGKNRLRKIDEWIGFLAGENKPLSGARTRLVGKIVGASNATKIFGSIPSAIKQLASTAALDAEFGAGAAAKAFTKMFTDPQFREDMTTFMKSDAMKDRYANFSKTYDPNDLQGVMEASQGGKKKPLDYYMDAATFFSRTADKGVVAMVGAEAYQRYKKKGEGMGMEGKLLEEYATEQATNFVQSTQQSRQVIDKPMGNVSGNDFTRTAYSFMTSPLQAHNRVQEKITLARQGRGSWADAARASIVYYGMIPAFMTMVGLGANMKDMDDKKWWEENWKTVASNAPILSHLPGVNQWWSSELYGGRQSNMSIMNKMKDELGEENYKEAFEEFLKLGTSSAMRNTYEGLTKYDKKNPQQLLGMSKRHKTERKKR